MSNSRKKHSFEQIPLLSVTQKLRQNMLQNQYKRRCCEKENLNQSKERRQSKCKEGNSSNKKMKKKKFLEQQLEKILQKRHFNEQSRINQIRSRNTFEFQDLKVEVKEMKDVLSKLTLDEKQLKQIKQSQDSEIKEEFQVMCQTYKRKIDDLRAQLQIQKQTNTKLQQAHIQSQLFAKQTKDYCQSINKQLAQLGEKHIKCEENVKELKQKRAAIQIINSQKYQLGQRVRTLEQEKSKLNQLLEMKTKEQDQMKKKFQTATEEYRKTKESELFFQKQSKAAKQQNCSIKERDKKLQEQLRAICIELKQKQAALLNLQANSRNILQIKVKQQQKVKELTAVSLKQLQNIAEIQRSYAIAVNQLKITEQSLAEQKQKVIQLGAKNELLIELKSKIQVELKKIQAQYNNTKLDLGNTKQKLGSLSSMQKKCEELYVQIKLQKERCASFGMETIKERQNLQKKLKDLEEAQEMYISKVQQLFSSNETLKSALQEVKQQSKKHLEEKIKIAKRSTQLQQQISALHLNKLQLMKENQVILNKMVIMKSQFNQKQKNWATQRQRYEIKQELLQKQKRDLQHQAKSTIQAFKKRNDQIQAQNISYQKEFSDVNEQKLTAISHVKNVENNLKAIMIENQKIKSSINTKQQIISDLQYNLDQTKAELTLKNEKIAELQLNEKNLTLQWERQCCELKKDVAQLQRQNKQNRANYEKQIKQWKEKTFSFEKELQVRDEKIMNLSEIRENLQIQLQDIQQKLHEAETIRLSLSSQLIQYQQTTKRNEQHFQEEKNLLECEIKLKNKAISQLKSTMKLVRDQSMQIKQEVEEYNKIVDLQQLVGSQVRLIQQSLNHLIKQKEQLQLSINILKSQNNELSNSLFRIENQSLQWPKKELDYKQTINSLEEQLQILYEDKDKAHQELQIKKNEIQKLAQQLYAEKSTSSLKLLQSQTTITSTKIILDQSSQKCSQLNETIKQKETTIKEQSQKLKLFQEKRIKVINQVHSIQNQISEIALKNSQLEEQKNEIQQSLAKKQKKIQLLSQKITILLQNNSVLEEQKIAFNEQEALLRRQIAEMNQKLRLTNENHQKNVNQIYEACQTKKNEATNVLKQKIRQLASQLNNCVNKLNSKNKDVQLNQGKYLKIQALLQENHEILNQQRKQREKLAAANNQLLIQIDNYKIQLGSKEKEVQALQREKTIFRQKLVQQESKYEILRRKYQNLEHQRYSVQKEMENQNISLRVLKEENKNIEKVMYDQLSQRKEIIQQLMTQKRMLYAQLNQQR